MFSLLFSYKLAFAGDLIYREAQVTFIKYPLVFKFRKTVHSCRVYIDTHND